VDPYRILQVRPDAEDAVIAAAYRALARRYHPDIVGDRSGRSMAEINAAWEILRDPARRREYDHGAREADASGRSGHAPRAAGTAAAHRAAGMADADRRHTPPSRNSGLNGTPRSSGGTHPNGVGAAGPPPGRPTGSILTFGRHIGWSVGEIARVDPGYLEWLEEKPEGRPYLEEIDAILKRAGYRQAPETGGKRRRWLRRS
jgi:curved DNA-binding protein CbpA